MRSEGPGDLHSVLGEYSMGKTYYSAVPLREELFEINCQIILIGRNLSRKN